MHRHWISGPGQQVISENICFDISNFLIVRIEFARGMLANKEDWNKLVMAAKMVSDPNIQVMVMRCW